MGKRNKRSKQKHSALETDAPPAQSQPETTQATTRNLPRAIQREILKLCEGILQSITTNHTSSINAISECSQRVGGISNPVQEWNNYLEVEELVEKIRIFQFGQFRC